MSAGPESCKFCSGAIWKDHLGFWYLADMGAEKPWHCPQNLSGHAPAVASTPFEEYGFGDGGQ